MPEAGDPQRAAAQAQKIEAYPYGEWVVSHYRLPNGLELLHLPDHSAPLFSYQTWFRVGSRNERPGKTGLAHLFEHLMFKGTSAHPEGVFDRELEALGARVNAATWLDWTYYYEDVPGAEHLELVIRLEADRMQNMLLLPEPLESERKVVINERKERVDNDPEGQLSELLWAQAFEAHPYGQPTIGWMPDIQGLSLEDCLDFHRRWYAPNQATVVVVGDIEAAQLLPLIERYYGQLAPGEAPAYRPTPEPKQTAPRRQERTLPILSERLLMAYHAPAAGDDRLLALELLNELLFEGDSARLYRALVTDSEIATEVYTMVPALAEPGLYEIDVELAPGQPAEAAEAVLLAAFEALLAEGLRPGELEKAKARLQTRFYLNLQTAQQRAEGLGYWATVLGRPAYLFELGARYEAIDEAQLMAVAREVLRPEGRTVVIGRPLEDGEGFGEEGEGFGEEGEGFGEEGEGFGEEGEGFDEDDTGAADDAAR